MTLEQGAPLTGHERLAPGVLGYSIEVEGALWVPWVMAEHEGAGDVGRYLDSLPLDRRVVFPNVISPRLLGMLLRRGFSPRLEWSEGADATIEVWTRP